MTPKEKEIIEKINNVDKEKQEIKEGEKPTKKPIRRAPKKTEEVKEGE